MTTYRLHESYPLFVLEWNGFDAEYFNGFSQGKSSEVKMKVIRSPWNSATANTSKAIVFIIILIFSLAQKLMHKLLYSNSNATSQHTTYTDQQKM